MKKFIVWTGKAINGTVHPSCSLATADTIEEATGKARDWQEYVTRHYPTRRACHCVITTYGQQKIIASVPEKAL